MRNVFGLPIRKAARNPIAGKFLLEHEDLLPNESKIADIIGTALEELRAGAFGQSLMNALSARNATTAVANLDWGRFGQTLSTMRMPLEQQLAASGTGEAKALGDVIGHMAFNVTDPRAVEYAANRAGEMVVTFSQAVKDDVRGVITTALVNQTNPREIAGMIDRQVGLFPRWANAVENRYQSSLSSFMSGGMSYADAHDRAMALADAYRDRLIDKRCQMIARTEVIRAANEGRATAWAQAADAGLIDPATTTKEWIAEADACDECAEYDTEQVWLDDVFSSGDEMPPAHPNCRCSAVLVPDGEPTERPEATTTATDTLPAMTSEDITPNLEAPTAEDATRPEPFDDPWKAVDSFGFDAITDIAKGDRSGWSEAVSTTLGYDALPTVLTREEFNTRVASGEMQEWFRGTTGVDAETHAEQFRSGDLFHGTGQFGDGTYAAQDRAVAVGYAGGADTVFSIGGPPTARVIDYGEVKAMQQDFVNSLYGHTTPMSMTATERTTLAAIMENPGRFASILGYDGIRVPESMGASVGDFMVWLNRGAVVTAP